MPKSSVRGRNLRIRQLAIKKFKNLMSLVHADENESCENGKSNMIEKMIGEIRKRPAIWDITDAGYKNEAVVQSLWNELSHIFGLPGADLLQKWNILVGCFKNYHSICAVRNSSHDQEQRCAGLPPWSYLNRMWFLNKSGNIQRQLKKPNKYARKTNTQNIIMNHPARHSRNLPRNSCRLPSGSTNTELPEDIIIKLEPPDVYSDGDTNLTEEFQSQTANQHCNRIPQFNNICSKLRSLQTDLRDIESNLRCSELLPNTEFANAVTSFLGKMEPEKQAKCQIMIFEILHSVLQE